LHHDVLQFILIVWSEIVCVSVGR